MYICIYIYNNNNNLKLHFETVQTCAVPTNTISLPLEQVKVKLCKKRGVA